MKTLSSGSSRRRGGIDLSWLIEIGLIFTLIAVGIVALAIWLFSYRRDADEPTAINLTPHEAYQALLKSAEDREYTRRAAREDEPPSQSIAKEELALGEAAFNAAAFAEAIEHLSRSIEADPRSAQAHYLRGRAHMALYDRDAALADLSTAIEIDPRHMDALQERANLHVWEWRLEEARRDYDARIEHDPTDAKLYATRGEILLWLGKPDDALADVNEALHYDGRLGEAYAVRGSVYYIYRGDYQRAQEDFHNAQELAPDNFLTTILGARISLDRKDYRAAYDYSNRAMARGVWGNTTHSLRGQARMGLGDWNLALADFDSAIKASLELGPTEAVLYRYKATCLRHLGRDDEAAREEERARLIEASLAPKNE